MEAVARLAVREERVEPAVSVVAPADWETAAKLVVVRALAGESAVEIPSA